MRKTAEQKIKEIQVLIEAEKVDATRAWRSAGTLNTKYHQAGRVEGLTQAISIIRDYLDS